MNDALGPTYQARQMEEFEVKLHDDGISMKVYSSCIITSELSPALQ